MPTSTEIKEARVRSNPMVNNLLINPGFEVWQRGAGPWNTDNDMTADEWRLVIIGGGGASTTHTITRSSSPYYGNYCLQSVVNYIDNPASILQSVEACQDLEGKWVTFSVWVYSLLENSVYASITDYTTGSQVAVSTYHQGGGWERLTATKQIRTGLTMSHGSWPHGFGMVVNVVYLRGATFLVDGAVLAEGYYPEGVPFVPPNPAEERERCQRFYQTSGGDPYNGSIFRQDVVSGSNYFVDHFFQTPMYATPTLTITNGGNSGFGASPAGTQVDRKGFKEWRTATATAASRYFWSYWEAEVS